MSTATIAALSASRLPARGETDDALALATTLARLLLVPLDIALHRDPTLGDRLAAHATDLGARAYPSGSADTAGPSRHAIDHAARTALHRALLLLYQQHVQLPSRGGGGNQFHPLACRLMAELEGPWERAMLARAARFGALSDATLPGDARQFATWYQTAAFSHPLYEHGLYTFLACEADRAQLEWFFRMEAAGEAAFDDLVALGQLGTRGEVKLEMGRNYWDELGNGRPQAVHTFLFHRLIDGLALEAPSVDALPWPVLAGANVMLWSCIHRRNAFRAQGTLGAVELLAPQRCTRVVHGAQRLGIARRTVSYYAAHAIIDVGHAEGWLDHVIRAQVAEMPASRIGIAEGLYCRADASLDYFDYCLTEMRGHAPRAGRSPAHR